MSHRQLFYGTIVCGALVVALVGCSDGRLPTYPVTGRIVFADGSPVRMGMVELKSREHGIHARGEINREGHFVLSTYEPGDGAVAGTHDCVVVQMVMVEDYAGFQPTTEGVVHPKFGSYATSKLVVDVRGQDRNAFYLQVEPLAPGTFSGSAHKHEHADHGRDGGLEPSK
ncbi:MAG: hypothetical protein KatS3mg111_1866 [Pirellulaceae bacterium]|nr:MAG: hypothetical protein KatS3mg111_1866 [Pirellulaceae bacterium]